MALTGQCNLVSIMVPPKVSLKEWFSQKRRKIWIIAQNVIVMQHFEY